MWCVLVSAYLSVLYLLTRSFEGHFVPPLVLAHTTHRKPRTRILLGTLLNECERVLVWQICRTVIRALEYSQVFLTLEQNAGSWRSSQMHHVLDLEFERESDTPREARGIFVSDNNQYIKGALQAPQESVRFSRARASVQENSPCLRRKHFFVTHTFIAPKHRFSERQRPIIPWA